MNENWDHEVDLLVVGSGGGGMTAALAANHLGLDVLVIEKTAFFGGSTARSGGAIWIPDNYLLAEEGIDDSFEMARQYMRYTVGDRVSQALQDAYLTHAPRMVDWLRDNIHSQGARWTTTELLERATGGPLDIANYKAHLHERYLPS